MADSRFVHVTYIRTTPEKLWRALIDPEFTRLYWMESSQESDWKPGSAWRGLSPAGQPFASGEIVEIEPPRRLVLTWQHEKNPEIQAEGHSRLTYDLEKQGETVKLTIIHQIDKPGSKLIESVSGGWPLIIASLKSLLETGESLEATRHWPKSSCSS